VVLHTHNLSKESLQTLQHQAQTKLNWWDKLVKVTGGKLNPKKCCGLLYTWVPDSRGILQLQQPTLLDPFLYLPFKHIQQLISILRNNKGTQYLGLYVTANHNMQPMETHLWDKAQLYTMAFHRTPMT